MVTSQVLPFSSFEKPPHLQWDDETDVENPGEPIFRPAPRGSARRSKWPWPAEMVKDTGLYMIIHERKTAEMVVNKNQTSDYTW